MGLVSCVDLCSSQVDFLLKAGNFQLQMPGNQEACARSPRLLNLKCWMEPPRIHTLLADLRRMNRARKAHPPVA